jgi:predicted transcriptional regulator
MRRSKLEFYEDIINALAKKALTIDGLAFQGNMDCVTLQQRLDFLVKNNITDIEISRDNKTYYVLTRRGLAVSKTLRLAKRLEKLQTTARKAETRQETPSISEEDEEKEASTSRNQNY